MKTTLTVEIEYDQVLTDPECLATVMDWLLETALSTPGILEEYGNPTFGEFLIAEPPPQDNKCMVVLDVSGGLVQDVYCSEHVAKVVVADWDTEGCAPQEIGIVEVADHDGTPRLVSVAEFPLLPLEKLTATLTQKTLHASGIEVPQGGPDGFKRLTRYVVFDHDMDELVATTAFEDREEAVDLASQLNNAVVLKLTIPCQEMGSGSDDGVADDDPRCDCELPGYA